VAFSLLLLALGPTCGFAQTVSTPSVGSVMATSVTLSARAVASGSSALGGVGFFYAPTATNSNPQQGGTGAIEVAATIPGVLPGTFSAMVTGLTTGVPYSYTAYAFNATSISYTPAATFTPLGLPIPAVPTVLNITSTSALISGSIAPTGTGLSLILTQSGLVYAPTSTNSNPALGGAGVVVLTALLGETSFSFNPNTLAPGVSYSVSTFGTDPTGTAYSVPTSFTTSGTLSISTASLLNGVLNQAGYKQTIVTAGGTGLVTFTTLDLLPTGLTLSATGVISGTPTITGTYTFTVTATDSVGGTVSKAFSIAITSSSTGTAPTVTNPNTSTLTATGATLGGTVTANGGSPIAGVGFFYAPTATNSNPQQGGTGAVEVDGTIPSSLPGTFSTNATGLTPGTSYSFTAYAYNSVGIGYSPAGTFTTPGALALTPVGPALPNWDVNIPGYHQTIGVTGGTGSATFAVTSGALPPGLTLNASTGVISGTPTQSSPLSYAFDITATSGFSSATGLYTSRITSPPTFGPPIPANGVINQPYLQAISFFGGSGNFIFISPSGQFPPGLTLNSSTGVISGTPTAIGTYNFTLEVGDLFQNTPLTPFRITITNAAPPQITSQPQDVTVTAGQPATFTVAATGTPLTYQWYDNNTPISGATGASYTIASATPANFGFYDVLVTNPSGSVASNYAILGVRATGAPAVTGQPQSQTMAAGATMVLTVTSSGTVAVGSVSEGPRNSPDAASPTTYQWYLNGVPIAGATSPNLVLSNVSAADAGSYKCVVSNASGSNLTSAAIVNVTATSNPGRLINLSVNTFDGTGSQAMTIGFVNGGAQTAGSQPLLIRATGPALTAFGITGVLPDPSMTVFNSAGGVVTTNAGWASSLSNQSAVAAADAATFAFPLTNPASLDSAVVATLPESTGYTVQIAGKSGDTGNALAEVYDDTASGTYALSSPRLTNVSCKTQVSAGKILTVGFVLGGTTSKTVLVRASGPALAAFGVSGVMPDPQLTLFNTSGTALASNAGWGGDPQLAAAMAEVFAFPYSNPSSADSALLVTLPPGAYTAQATSATGTAGITLVEIYDVP
jgi:hypothetical protein